MAKGAKFGNRNAAGPRLTPNFSKLTSSKVELNKNFNEGVNRGFATYGAYKGAHMGAGLGLSVGGLPGAVVGGAAGAVLGGGSLYLAGRTIDHGLDTLRATNGVKAAKTKFSKLRKK